MDAYEINKEALLELEAGNEQHAQQLFRYNVRVNPSGITWGNLGAFYCAYGSISESGKFRNAEKIGQRYLSRANASDDIWETKISLTTSMMEQGSYESALHLFQEASLLKKDCFATYNMGVCLFQLGKYGEAETIFADLCNHRDAELIEAECLTHPIIPYLNCLLIRGNSEACLKTIEAVEKNGTVGSWDYMDLFELCYLCGAYDRATFAVDKLMREWSIDIHTLAMIASLNQLNAFSGIKEMLQDNRKALWDRLIKDKEFRVEQIQSRRYIPPKIELYLFAQ